MDHEYRATCRIGRFSSRGEAQVARAMLSEHGIEARVDADDAAGLHPELSLATGGIHLTVAEADAEEARELLDDVAAAPATAGDAPDGDPADRDRLPSRSVRTWVLLVAALLVALTVVLALSDLPRILQVVTVP